MSTPRIGLVGAGAVGGLLAATLAHNGCTVEWVVRDAARRRQLRQLTLVLGERAQPAPQEQLHVVTEIGELPSTLDWIISAVKAHQVADVLSAVAGRSADRVLVVANGLHEQGVHLGLLYGGAQVQDAKVVACPINQLLVGVLAGDTEPDAALTEALNAPWLSTQWEADIVPRMWHKLSLNCVVNPLTALLDCRNGELPAAGELGVIPGLLAECDQVARTLLASRWQCTPAALLAAVGELLRTTAGNSSSMREDVRRGRQTEITHLNLAVAAVGRRHGIECPLNEALGRMISLLTNNASL